MIYTSQIILCYISTTGISPSVLNHIMERSLFCHSPINFKSVDTAELFHRTNFLGLKKREKDRKNSFVFAFCSTWPP